MKRNDCREKNEQKNNVKWNKLKKKRCIWMRAEKQRPLNNLNILVHLQPVPTLLFACNVLVFSVRRINARNILKLNIRFEMCAMMIAARFCDTWSLIAGAQNTDRKRNIIRRIRHQHRQQQHHLMRCAMLTTHSQSWNTSNRATVSLSTRNIQST